MKYEPPFTYANLKKIQTLEAQRKAEIHLDHSCTMKKM